MYLRKRLFQLLKICTQLPGWPESRSPFASKVYRSIHFQNDLKEQSKWAKECLESNDPNFSEAWGKVDTYNFGLGDYRIINTEIRNLASEKVVLELGCLDGKWTTVYHEVAKNVWLVDLDNALEETLIKKFGAKINFYQTVGNELTGISDKSIDLIFSMDSLVRCDLKIIRSYFKEFSRVLKSGGVLYIHLPCDSVEGSVKKMFTPLSIIEIKNLSLESHFTNLILDNKTLEHGIMLKATRT
jgi:SAM-dependent methyltransferase